MFGACLIPVGSAGLGIIAQPCGQTTWAGFVQRRLIDFLYFLDLKLSYGCGAFLMVVSRALARPLGLGHGGSGRDREAASCGAAAAGYG